MMRELFTHLANVSGKKLSKNVEEYGSCKTILKGLLSSTIEWVMSPSLE
jgi:hypothetical protein